MMDLSLDKNIFYNALLTTYLKQHQTAAAKKWLICVPHNLNGFGSGSSSVIGILPKIDQDLISLHILKPSPLLKSHYVPANPAKKQHKTICIELTSSELIVKRLDDESEMNTVRILSEELAYNSNNEQYKLIVIDRPLLDKNCSKTKSQQSRSSRDQHNGSTPSTTASPHSNSSETKSTSNHLHHSSSTSQLRQSPNTSSTSTASSNQRSSPLFSKYSKSQLFTSSLDDIDWRNKELISCSDCEDFLRWLAPEVKRDVEGKILQFCSIFYFTANTLDDAAKRIRAIYEWAVARFLDKLPPLESDRTLSIKMRNSAESFINCLIYEKVFITLKQEAAPQEAAFREKLRSFKRKRQMSIVHFGGQQSLESFSSNATIDGLLLGLDSLPSPLEKMHSLKRILNEITMQLDLLLQLSGGLLGRLSLHDSPQRHQYSTISASSSLSATEDDMPTLPQRPVSDTDSGTIPDIEPPPPSLPPPSSSPSSDNNNSSSSYRPQATAVTADDLIAALICVLISCDPPHLITNLRYLDCFTCTTSERDSLAYAHVTFEAATSYIQNFNAPLPMMATNHHNHHSQSNHQA